MKKVLLFLLSLFFSQITSYSQHCLPEGITFSTQVQIDSFQVNYPGCTVIEGDVNIYGDEISDLAGINVLDSIYGDVEIQGVYQLADMNGLNNIIYIGGNLWFANNDGFVNLTGLDKLRYIGGRFDILDNTSITSLSGLENLSYANGINIQGNDALESLTGLEGLDSVGQGLSISWNENLSNLEALSNLTSINGDLNLYHNSSLTGLTGLQNISVSSLSSIWIIHNQNLSECAVQGLCDFISNPYGSINIYDNAPGCNNPHEIAENCGITLSCLPYGNYYFSTQADVDSFPSYFPDCHKIEGYLGIESEEVSNLDSLSAIDTINGSLYICTNDNLSSLNGLNNIKTIQGSLWIGQMECYGNGGLTDLEGLNSLTSIGEDLEINSNHGLLTLSGLDSLSSIGNGLSIVHNGSLKNLHGLENLNSAGGLVYIAQDYSLLTLNGLYNLVNIGGILVIEQNSALFSIDGIKNVDAEQLTQLYIDRNEVLSNCDVQSVCAYLADPGGALNIRDNAPGCNSQEEVELACGVGVGEVVSRQSSVVSYPNPVADFVTFDIQMPESAKVNLTIFSSLGQAVATILDETLEKGGNEVTWDAKGVVPGIYFYLLSGVGKQYLASGKIVIIE